MMTTKELKHRKILKSLEAMNEPLPKLNRERSRLLKRLKTAFPHTDERMLRFRLGQIEFIAGQIAYCYEETARHNLGIDREKAFTGKWERGFDKAIATDILDMMIDSAEHYTSQIKADDFLRL
jgi:hypothetical protein